MNMVKISETIEITKDELNKMQELQKKFNMTTHEFIQTVVKEAIRAEYERRLVFW